MGRRTRQLHFCAYDGGSGFPHSPTAQDVRGWFGSGARAAVFVALPGLTVRPVLLICRQPRHAVPRQDAVHRERRDRDLVEAAQVRRDPARAEVIVLTQAQDLADDVATRRARRVVRRPRRFPRRPPVAGTRHRSPVPSRVQTRIDAGMLEPNRDPDESSERLTLKGSGRRVNMR
jgi:hypothetical protein